MTRRERMLHFIAAYRGTHGYGPTTREIARALGTGSTSVVAHHLDKLEANGLITWAQLDNGRRVTRSVRLTGRGRMQLKSGVQLSTPEGVS